MSICPESIEIVKFYDADMILKVDHKKQNLCLYSSNLACRNGQTCFKLKVWMFEFIKNCGTEKIIRTDEEKSSILLRIS